MNTNYKSGINIDYSGDFAKEVFFYDSAAQSRHVVYLTDSATITCSHNSNNIAGKLNGSDGYESAGLGVGVIKYKIDGDYRAEHGIGNYNTYSSPLNFSSLNYGEYGESGKSVVGSTGDNGVAQTIANKETQLNYGVLDDIGDEWHTIGFCDDDNDPARSVEYRSSDSKIVHFVVNPKTPCFIPSTSSDGQWYTTPPKKYFIPKIYNQTTYIQGSVNISLKDVNGNNVFYRINGGSYTDSGSSEALLTEANFSTGSNTLEYYYLGNESFVRTRIVVKNPGFPSATETHGDRFWGNDAANWPDIAARLDGSAPGSPPSFIAFADSRTPPSHYGQGKRNRGNHRGFQSPDTGMMSLLARYHGMSHIANGTSETNASLSKQGIMECSATIDPLGFELNHSNNSIPIRNLVYRGYWDADPFLEACYSYDIIAGYYRTDQGFTDGLSPIEDYYIRDILAEWIHRETFFWNAGYQDVAFDAQSRAGMWPCGRLVGASAAASIMPAYSTDYYGTCGLDGNTTTYLLCPFRDVGYTWKRILFDNDLPLTVYPNVHKGDSWLGTSGLHDLITATGEWTDRTGYTQNVQMGHLLGAHLMIRLMNLPALDNSTYELFVERALNSDLVGTDNTRQKIFSSLMNNVFANNYQSRAQVVVDSYSENDTSEFNEDKLLQVGGFLNRIWYQADLNIAPPNPPVDPSALQPIITNLNPGEPDPNIYQMTTGTEGATIHYTLDGSPPTDTDLVYGSGIVISGVTTIKAIAVKTGLNDSTIASVQHNPVTPGLQKPINLVATAISTGIRLTFDGNNVPLTEYSVNFSFGAYQHEINLGLEEVVDHDIPEAKDHEVYTYWVYATDGVNQSEDSDPVIASVDSLGGRPIQDVVANPVISQVQDPGVSTISIECATVGASIYYTLDGSTPTDSSLLYSGDFTVTESTQINAIGIKAGCTDSPVSVFNASIVILPASDPVITTTTLPNETLVSITSETEDAIIYYTTDGGPPTPSSQVYSGEFSLSNSSTVRAIVTKSGFSDSNIIDLVVLVFQKLNSPGVSFDDQTNLVTMTSNNTGSTIYYTTDGSHPSDDIYMDGAEVYINGIELIYISGIEYTGPFLLSENTIITAVEVKNGFFESDATILDVSFDEANYTVEIRTRTGFGDRPVVITKDDDLVDIHFTTDGTAPTELSPIYNRPFYITQSSLIQALAIKSGVRDLNVKSMLIIVEEDEESS